MILRESGPRSHWRRLLVFEPRITVRGTNENRRGTDWRSVLPSIGIRTLAAYTLRNRAYHDSLTRPKSSHRLASRVTLSALSFPLWRWCTLSLCCSCARPRSSFSVPLTANDGDNDGEDGVRARKNDRLIVYTRRERSSGDRREKRNRWRYRCVEEEREYGSSVPMQMRLDEIVWVRCTFGGPAVVRWKKREGRVGGRRGTVGGEGGTGWGRGEYKTRLLRGGARLLKARSLVRVALCTPSSMSLLVSISFYSRCGSFSSRSLSLSFSSSFVSSLSFCLFVIPSRYIPSPSLTLLRYRASPPLSNLTRVRAETRKRGATWQKRFETWKGSWLHASASLLPYDYVTANRKV